MSSVSSLNQDRLSGKAQAQPRKIVVLSGSGVSAESGLPTFRDAKGLWNTYSWQELASPDGWQRHPEAVQAFYNERRQKAWQAQPNAAHLAIASLEPACEVVIVTQNVDALHERAGSRQVVHLHGQLAYARGTAQSNPKRYRIDGDPIAMGQLCEDGTQLRPDIVWFGEAVQHFDEAERHVATASHVLVVGTSLTVYPAASLVQYADRAAQKVLVALDMQEVPRGFTFLQGHATEVVPALAARWLAEIGAT
ncbi:NAD-dependent deacetylase [Variovorax sp. OK605]|uniref:SIR2 family NAD-dependent protein deacylase n=1 Tax=unclassified Variovorax TaxID=663243 RepID=UPI0008B2C97E|nr:MULTISPECIES: NAD-dependent deacylase [unclassified Variovorax]SEJ57561.1 NAD-dependent deacetylase [Variovorax sp. OK202]SFC62387.1 NAD-dependent deacetylase [Variovorax sp. OK212]SFQ55377.1 NAD-dependent deacetylase [Variovorax sp. OK605]